MPCAISTSAVRMLGLGSRPLSDVAQQTCSQLRPRSSRWLASCGFSFNPASMAFQSKALTSGSMDVFDTILLDSRGEADLCCGEPAVAPRNDHHQQLHQDLVIRVAIYRHLPREAATFGEAQSAIEELRG